MKDKHLIFKKDKLLIFKKFNKECTKVIWCAWEDDSTFCNTICVHYKMCRVKNPDVKHPKMVRFKFR